MIQKIIKKSIESKIGENRDLDWSLGLLGGGLGVIVAPKAAWHSKKGPEGQNVYTFGSPFGDHFSLFFVVFSHPVFESPFWWLPRQFFDGFGEVFGIIFVIFRIFFGVVFSPPFRTSFSMDFH